MAAMDSVSSWLPQAYAQSPPPMAQAPKPTRVSSMSVQPSLVVGNEVVIVVLLLAAPLLLRGPLFFRPSAYISVTHQPLPASCTAVIAASGHAEPRLAELDRFRLAATTPVNPACSGASPRNSRSGGFGLSTSFSTASQVVPWLTGATRRARTCAACTRTGSEAGRSVACPARGPGPA